MTAALVPHNEVSSAVMETVILHGDLARLSPAQKLDYMHAVCKSLGLNPLTKPFAFLRLNGKEIMYALRDCTEQLRKLHAVSVTIAARETVEECYVVTARAQDSTGRCDESIGAVSIKGLTGEARANALMKTETKAKRRVTLSICGLGMLDETETETIPGATRAPEYTPPPAKTEAPRSDAPKEPSVTEATTQRTHSPTVTTSKPRTAADVPYCGTPLSPQQLKLIHVLRGQIGGVFSGDEEDARTNWGKALRVYRNAAGERITTSKDMCATQASHLIDRMQGYVAKQGQRAAQGFAPPPPTVGELYQRAFGDSDEGPQWLHGLFNVEHPQELSANDVDTAMHLLPFIGKPEYDERETSMRATGRVR